MRKALSLTLLGVVLLAARASAHAQPAAQQQPRTERSERCREAALKYIHPSPEKKYLTVEAEDAYEYEQAKKYLAVCGDSGDNLTRSVKESVASYEAVKTLARLLPAVRKAGSPESKDPNAYAAIAAAYESHLLMLTTWSRNGAKGLVEAIDKQTDLLIDAYARAVAACGERADCRPQKDAWTQKLTGAYKSRHGGSDAGLEEFIRGALERPLPGQ